MAKLDQYREIVQKLLQDYAAFSRDDQEVETELIFDTTRDHYQLVHIGWQGERRIYGCILHLNIKDGKIWLQHNGTENDIAAELVEMGIPKSDIVIGFHSPFKRQFTEYAVN
ncbi:element excision factor XisI family protein [Coleofasciculus sp. G2-EDA-02]|uniref:element excision factor XisI family protein n=1 Tax=unclassified Coleofasciculus TaxID=2692782 RepID=UPI00330378C4